MALLGGLTWALGWGTSNQGTLDATGSAERVEVPNVVGLPQNEAQKQLQEVRLKLGSQDEAPSNEVAAGTVIEQDPAARTEVDRGTAVGVVVSTGPLEKPTPQASPSAPATASPTALPSASPAAKAANKEAQKRREEAQKKAEERREEAFPAIHCWTRPSWLSCWRPRGSQGWWGRQ
jgi:hypothetical protein